MFGVGMILSTQNVSDFKTSKEDCSQFILSWVIHHVNSISKAGIANIFGASDPNGDRYMKNFSLVIHTTYKVCMDRGLCLCSTVRTLCKTSAQYEL